MTTRVQAAEDALADYMVRIQARSNVHPEVSLLACLIAVGRWCILSRVRLREVGGDSTLTVPDCKGCRSGAAMLISGGALGED